MFHCSECSACVPRHNRLLHEFKCPGAVGRASNQSQSAMRMHSSSRATRDTDAGSNIASSYPSWQQISDQMTASANSMRRHRRRQASQPALYRSVTPPATARFNPASRRQHQSEHQTNSSNRSHQNQHDFVERQSDESGHRSITPPAPVSAERRPDVARHRAITPPARARALQYERASQGQERTQNPFRRPQINGGRSRNDESNTASEQSHFSFPAQLDQDEEHQLGEEASFLSYPNAHANDERSRPDFIDFLPVRRLNSKDVQESSSMECSICLDEYKVGDKQMTLCCFHRFHADCAKHWLSRSRRCPVCKTPQDVRMCPESQLSPAFRFLQSQPSPGVPEFF